MMHTTLYSHSGQGTYAPACPDGAPCLPACLLVSACSKSCRELVPIWLELLARPGERCFPHLG
eukprot:5484742-Prymnesium_polylepis.1